jgi:hypothetical protein
MLFGVGVEWSDRAPAPTRWVRQTAFFPKGDSEQMTSLLWAKDYANTPVEGSLTELLRRLLKALLRPDALSRLGPEEHSFCAAGECAVVYFQNAETLSVTGVLTQAGPRLGAPPTEG